MEILKYSKQLTKELAKKMIITYYFHDRILNTAFNITPNSHNFIQIKSKITIKPI